MLIGSMRGVYLLKITLTLLEKSEYNPRVPLIKFPSGASSNALEIGIAVLIPRARAK